MSSDIRAVDTGGPVATHKLVPEGPRANILDHHDRMKPSHFLPNFTQPRLSPTDFSHFPSTPHHPSISRETFLSLLASTHHSQEFPYIQTQHLHSQFESELPSSQTLLQLPKRPRTEGSGDDYRFRSSEFLQPIKRNRSEIIDNEIASRNELTRHHMMNLGQSPSLPHEYRHSYHQTQEKPHPFHRADLQTPLPHIPPSHEYRLQRCVPQTTTPTTSILSSPFPPFSVAPTFMFQSPNVQIPFSYPGSTDSFQSALKPSTSSTTSTVEQPHPFSVSKAGPSNVSDSTVNIKLEIESDDIEASKDDNADNSGSGSIQVKKESELCQPTEDGETSPKTENEEAVDDDQNHAHDSQPLNRDDTDDKSGQVSQEPNKSSDNKVFLSCSLCEFKTIDRICYVEHIRENHSKVCFRCKFIADDLNQLAEHQIVCSGGEGSSSSTMPASPQTKEKNKFKKLVCKICQHVADNDKEFYEHRRTHISPDKLLCCTFCPFVTQYKHHLDYHLKNHTGNKPFKCKKCDYSCVNKSMLNSHMKSHSNFYSFRCHNCNYETKYMHALKMHCRKNQHQPRPVINPDGTINPYPIVDVYGNKRGPKVRKDSEGNIIYPSHYTAKIEMQSTLSESATTPSSSAPTPSTRTDSSPPTPYSLPMDRFLQQDSPAGRYAYSPYLGMDMHLRGGGFNSSIFNTPPQLPARMPSYINSPQSPVSSLPRNVQEALLKHITFVANQSADNTPSDVINTSISCHICEKTFSSTELLRAHVIYDHIFPKPSNIDTSPRAPLALPAETPKEGNHDFINTVLLLAQARSMSELTPFSPEPPAQQYNNTTTETCTPTENQRLKVTDDEDDQLPLDLSKDHTPPQQIIRRRLAESPMDVSPSSLTPPDTCSPPLKPRRTDHHLMANRRLEKINEEVNGSVDSEFLQTSSVSAPNGIHDNELEVGSEIRAESSSSSSSSPPPQSLNCSFCKISFGFHDMFSKHMAFHGVDDPLRCSFCKDSHSDFSAFYDHCFSCKHRQPKIENS